MSDRNRWEDRGDRNADRETAWHGEDRYPPNNPEAERARAYGAADYEGARYYRGPDDLRLDRAGRWPVHDPGRDSPGYREPSARHGQGEAGPRDRSSPWFGEEPGRREVRRGEGRSFWDRTRDELATWFGDRHAEQRRHADGEHRGRGPRNYRRADARISDDVHDRLTDDGWLDASDIEVQVENGEVTLNGRVRTRDDKRRAEDLADGVSGVTHVQNNLRADDSRPRGQERDEDRPPISPAYPL